MFTSSKVKTKFDSHRVFQDNKIQSLINMVDSCSHKYISSVLHLPVVLPGFQISPVQFIFIHWLVLKQLLNN